MKKWSISSLVILASLLVMCVQSYPSNSHKGWRVLEVRTPHDPRIKDLHSRVLRSLEEEHGVDVWRHHMEGGAVDIAVPLRSLANVTSRLKENNMTSKTIIEDLSRSLAENSHRRNVLPAGEATFNRFMEYGEIVSFIENLPLKYPGKVVVSQAGITAENRPIHLVTISSGEESIERPVIVVDAGAHAREWVSSAAALYLVSRLLESPSVAGKAEWRILPLLNPDGYVYTWEHDRFWRKTRVKVNGEDCYGVDLNRNFGFAWGGPDSSDFGCMNNYMGEEPFSEPESRAVRDAVLMGNRTKAYVTLHSYGQEIIFPWVYDITKSHHDYDRLARVATGMADAIFENDGTKYKVGDGRKFQYALGGTSADWASGAGVPLAFAMELRDLHDFIIPESLIPAAVEDVWISMSYLAEELVKHNKSEESETNSSEESSEAVGSPSEIPVTDVDVGVTTVIPEMERVTLRPEETTSIKDYDNDLGTVTTQSNRHNENEDQEIRVMDINNNALNLKKQETKGTPQRKPTRWTLTLS